MYDLAIVVRRGRKSDPTTKNKAWPVCAQGGGCKLVVLSR